jgi:hypothetical protein
VINSTACRVSLANLACSFAFRRADAPTLRPCQPLCVAYTRDCTGVDLIAAATALSDILNAAGASGVCAAPSAPCNGGASAAALAPDRVLAGRCESYRGQICKGIADSSPSVYLPAGVSQEAIERQIGQLAFMIPLVPVADGCRDALARFVCANVFPRCDRTQKIVPYLPYVLPLPQLPCRAVCTSYAAQCGRTLSFINQTATATADPAARRLFSCLLEALAPQCAAQTFQPPVVDCAGNVVVPGADDWPIVNATFAVSPALPALSMPCDAYQRPTATNVQCAYPTVLPNRVGAPAIGLDAALGDGSCQLACPLEYKAPEHIDKQNVLINVLTVASFFSSMFVFLTWSSFAERRSQWIVWNLSLCLFVFHLALFATFLVPVQEGRSLDFGNVSCKSRTEPVLFSDGWTLCRIQGLVIHFWSLSAALWWSLIGVDVILKIVISVPLSARQENVKCALFCALSYGIPFGFSVFGWSRQMYGSMSTSSPWCFIAEVSKNFGFLQQYFLWPLFAAWVTGTSSLLVILAWSVRSAIDSGSIKRAGWWHPYARPVFSMLAFLWVWVLILVSSNYYASRSAPLVGKIAQWVRCNIVSKVAVLASTGVDSVECARVEDYPAMDTLLNLGVFTPGLVLFLAYFSLESFSLWAARFRSLCPTLCGDGADRSKPNVARAANVGRKAKSTAGRTAAERSAASADSDADATPYDDLEPPSVTATSAIVDEVAAHEIGRRRSTSAGFPDLIVETIAGRHASAHSRRSLARASAGLLSVSERVSARALDDDDVTLEWEETPATSTGGIALISTGGGPITGSAGAGSSLWSVEGVNAPLPASLRRMTTQRSESVAEEFELVEVVDAAALAELRRVSMDALTASSPSSVSSVASVASSVSYASASSAGRAARAMPTRPTRAVPLAAPMAESTVEELPQQDE